MRDLPVRSPPRTSEDESADEVGFDVLIGDSAAMRNVVLTLRRIAMRDTTLLLEGESGTGKELAAHAVHAASPRCRGPFVVVDCRANAHSFVQEGQLESARGGTIFLDEIGELDLNMQPRLLRLDDNRRMRVVGSRFPGDVDFRIIAATSRDLGRETASGAFRADLYYRLAVNCVRLPPLSERREDVPQLWRHFCHQLSDGGPVDYLVDDETISSLMWRSWPGNVRQLRNMVERVAIFGPDILNTLTPPPFVHMASPVPASAMPDAPTAETPPVSFHDAKASLLASFERDFLTKTLAGHYGNITAAAAAAGLNRVHFLRLLDRHGLRKPRV